MSAALRRIEAPSATELAEALGRDADAWLERLGGAAWMHLPGREPGRARAVVTLLHGNEPSGTRALHRLLREGFFPAVDLHAFVMNVDAARRAPRFGLRMLPGERDLNRCFFGPHNDRPGRLAAELLDALRSIEPEAVVDLHNTSGSGPAYGVTTAIDARHLALTALFTDHIVLSDLRLGALMEALEDECPVVTIECGGANDERAHEVAYRGLHAFATRPQVTVLEKDAEVPQVLARPLRVELAADASVAYADAPEPGADVTLHRDLDRHNWAPVRQGETLGWLGARGLSALRVHNGSGSSEPAALFEAHEGCLSVRHPTHLLMVTTNPAIARADCLFYAVPLLLALPADAEFVRATPEFDERSVPQGLQRRHTTKPGTWARIRVVEGRIDLHWLDGSGRTQPVTPEAPAVIAPAVPHQVETCGPVRFRVEFHRRTADD